MVWYDHTFAQVPDCDFFLNKRDYPHLKFNSIGKKAVEPYGFIYDCDDRDPTVDVDLTRHNYPTYAPILWVQLDLCPIIMMY